MTRAPSKSMRDAGGLPRPHMKKMRWPFPLIWIVPLLAAIAAGFYYETYRESHGPEIVIAFSDAAGLRAGQTPVNHLGVQIGTVWDLELSPDGASALVHVQLHRSQAAFAKAGATFWIARPEISSGSISGLTTVISGPYIDALPGNGAPAAQFTGKDKAPVIMGPGLKIRLHSDRLEHLQRDSPIYFRGIQVGVIQSVQLSDGAGGVTIQAFIWQRYAPLVRLDSQFWIESGLNVSGGLFTGVKVNLESLRALLSGGVAFATPDTKTAPVKDGTAFELNSEPKKEWLAWAARIPLAPDTSDEGDKEGGNPQAAQTTIGASVKAP
jgi:paraquat-inducible protein B